MEAPPQPKAKSTKQSLPQQQQQAQPQSQQQPLRHSEPAQQQQEQQQPPKQQLQKQISFEKDSGHEGFVDYAGDSLDDAAAGELSCTQFEPGHCCDEQWHSIIHDAGVLDQTPLIQIKTNYVCFP